MTWLSRVLGAHHTRWQCAGKANANQGCIKKQHGTWAGIPTGLWAAGMVQCRHCPINGDDTVMSCRWQLNAVSSCYTALVSSCSAAHLCTCIILASKF
jgi:hypothetical protein